MDWKFKTKCIQLLYNYDSHLSAYLDQDLFFSRQSG